MALAVWLAGLWPDPAAPPQQTFAAGAACVVMQAGMLVGKPRRRLGPTLVRATPWVACFVIHSLGPFFVMHASASAYSLLQLSSRIVCGGANVMQFNWQGTVVLVASSVFNAIFILAGFGTAVGIWCGSQLPSSIWSDWMRSAMFTALPFAC